MLGNRTNRPEAQAKGGAATGQAADGFAANVLPVVPQLQAVGVVTVRAIARGPECSRHRHGARRCVASFHGARPTRSRRAWTGAGRTSSWGAALAGWGIGRG